jgi:hypothetical protein
MTPIPSGRIGASLSFLWSLVGGDICIRIYNTGAIALNYFQRRKRSFRSMRISFRLSISRSYFTSRERRHLMIKFHLQAIRYSRVTGQQLYTKSRERLMASRRRQQRSSFRSSVRLYIPKKKEWPLSGRGG